MSRVVVSDVCFALAYYCGAVDQRNGFSAIQVLLTLVVATGCMFAMRGAE